MLRRIGRAQEADELVSGSVNTGSARFTRSGQFEVIEVNPELHQAAIDGERSWEDFRNSAERAFKEGDYPGAQTMWQAALKRAASLPETDPRLCVTLEGLAELAFKQQNYGDAEPYCKRVLKIYERMLGAHHPDVGIVANNLAMLYHAQRNYHAADEYYKQALSIRSKVLGGEHPAIMNLVMNYTHLLAVTGRRSEAEELKMYTQPSKGRWTRSGSYQVVSIPTVEQLHEKIP
jgi:tetratricopeptide (TPR) repeat protein